MLYYRISGHLYTLVNYINLHINEMTELHCVEARCCMIPTEYTHYIPVDPIKTIFTGSFKEETTWKFLERQTNASYVLECMLHKKVQLSLFIYYLNKSKDVLDLMECLEIAAKNNILSYVKCIRAKPTSASIQYACRNKNYRMVRYLIENGPPVSDEKFIYWCSNGNTKLVRNLYHPKLSFKAGSEGLRMACRFKKYGIVSFLLQKDLYNAQAFEYAIADCRMLELFLKYNWDKSSIEKCGYKATKLILSYDFYTSDEIQKLYDKETNWKKAKLYILYGAVPVQKLSHQSYEMARLLLSFNAKVTRESIDWAHSEGNTKLEELLLKAIQ